MRSFNSIRRTGQSHLAFSLSLVLKGEGREKGSSEPPIRKMHPLPSPLPEYREREWPPCLHAIAMIRRMLLALLLTLTGCTVHPNGECEERSAALQAGKPFEARAESRQITPLPDHPTPDQLVEYALLNNAELEQHYWEWRSAIEQIPQDGSQTATLNISAGTTITNGHTSWGSSSVGLSNDPMTDIKVPAKLDAAAKQALENARAAGRRFIKAKFDLRNKVLGAYYDYALTAELIRLEQSNQQLLKTTATVTESRNRAGTTGQQDVLKAANEVDISNNDIANMHPSQLTKGYSTPSTRC